eukprot:EG_transcript_3279
MSLSEENDLCRRRLKAIAEALVAGAHPYFALFFPVHDHCARILTILQNYAAEVAVGVFGAPGTGRSTLLNALCGAELLPRAARDRRGEADRETQLRVDVRPVSQPSLLVPVSNVPLADGLAEVARWLTEANRLLREARGRPAWDRGAPRPPEHVRLDVALAAGTVVEGQELLVTLAEVPVNATLTTSSSFALLSKCQVVSTEWHWQAAICLVNYLALNSPAEVFAGITDSLNPAALRAFQARLLVVVTHADDLIALETGASHAHRPAGAPTFCSIDAVQAHVARLARDRLGLELRPQQIVVGSAVHGLYCRLVGRADTPPTVDQLYEYFELTNGSDYMQTIDSVKEADLRQFARQKAPEVVQLTGVPAVEQFVERVRRHSGAVFLHSACCALQHVAAGYASVLAQQATLLQEDIATKAEELASLEEEWRWVMDRLSAATSVLQGLRGELLKLYSLLWHDFWLSRMEEWGWVFDGKPRYHFGDRQQGNIYTLYEALRQFDEFLPRYVKDRVYMERQVWSPGAPCPVEGTTASEFVHDRPAKILELLEEERFEKAADVNRAMMHHVRDELERLIPVMEETLLERRSQIVTDLCEAQPMRELWARVERSAGSRLDVAALRATLCDRLTVLEAAEKTRNNAFRDIPDHVAQIMLMQPVAADVVELRQQLYNAWRLYATRTNPLQLLGLNEEPLEEAIQAALGCVTRHAGHYIAVLQAGIVQLREELAELEGRRASVPPQAEATARHLQELETLGDGLQLSHKLHGDSTLAA